METHRPGCNPLVMLFRICAIALALALPASAAANPAVSAPSNPDWTQPFPPFHIVGNIYYVGSKDLAAYLITTPQGDILINSNLETSVPQIKTSIEQLGFHLGDVKILLISHAHFDHAAGSAQLLKLTGARYLVMDADASVIETGGRTDFHYFDSKDMYFPPAKVNRVLHDGDQVKLGNTVLVAHRTGGHTKGCTTWTMDVSDQGKTYHVVIVGSPNVNPGYKLVKNAKYPNIAADYQATFRTLKGLPCDIFLGAHGSYFDMAAKIARRDRGERQPFLDPAGYRTYIAERELAFQSELRKQEGH